MIDLHGRHLPWVGDGAGSLDQALGMLRAAQDEGVQLAVLAPSIDPRRMAPDRADLERKFATFAQLAARRGLRIELRLGAELVHGPGAIEAVDAGAIPFVGDWEGLRVALLAWSEDFVPVGAIGVVQALARRGVLPMLAHPERNPGVVRAPSTLDLFLCDGCLVQLDAGSILGWHGPQVRDTAFRLIEAGTATVLASGAADGLGQPPSLRAARDIVAQRFGEELARRLVERNPSRIVPAGPPAPRLDPTSPATAPAVA